MNGKKLYRSNTDKMIAGVAGGLGEYLDVDPTIIRLAFALLALIGGHGVLIYLVLWLIVPLSPYGVPQPPVVSQPPYPPQEPPQEPLQ
jgi:phage shock protein C